MSSTPLLQAHGFAKTKRVQSTSSCTEAEKPNVHSSIRQKSVMKLISLAFGVCSRVTLQACALRSQL